MVMVVVKYFMARVTEVKGLNIVITYVLKLPGKMK